MTRSPYTTARLTEAAESSRTMTEMLLKLGVAPTSPTRKYLRERMRRLGIPTDHFEHEGVRWSRAVLEPAVAASISVSEVLRRLGIDEVGGHHSHISRRIKAYGIDTSHFHTPRGPGRRHPRQSAGEVLVMLDRKHPRRVPSERLRRALREVGVPERCASCGIEASWRGHPLPLEVDHIDGDWRDNRIGNLRLLCPNCHATTDTYRGRRAWSGVTRRAAAAADGS
ncbi:HNH endonuclease signature motif containing protein [Streptomyces sp. NPDC005963]|uniref:HNH endonuclease signature motif containing protein n=1 Tax=Streptomyces sp. NPDC005963 TaxID=3156721 RepID=UPI0033DD9673